jgi:hypothetical protein
VAAQDGLLVHDIYGDGSVRDNSQFAFARHGGESDLQGLAGQFDSNNDGVLNANDTQFDEFAVWQDTDQDGVADAGEVKTLADLGITSLQLNSDGVARNPETGVTEVGRSTAQLANGSTMLVADAAFNYTLGTAETVQADDAKSTDALAPLALATADEQASATAADAATAFENKPYTLSPEQMQEFQDLVTEVTNAVNEGAVNVAISEVTPTGTQPVVFEVPTHCEPSVFLPESMVLDLNPASWNKPYTLSAEQLSELGLPASTDGSLASLNVTDVLLSLAQGVTQSALQVNGTPVTADTLNLSNLLGPDAAPTQLTATGTVQHEGQTYTYQVDANLQALLDQQQLTTS